MFFVYLLFVFTFSLSFSLFLVVLSFIPPSSSEVDSIIGWWVILGSLPVLSSHFGLNTFWYQD